MNAAGPLAEARLKPGPGRSDEAALSRGRDCEPLCPPRWSGTRTGEGHLQTPRGSRRRRPGNGPFTASFCLLTCRSLLSVCLCVCLSLSRLELLPALKLCSVVFTSVPSLSLHHWPLLPDCNHTQVPLIQN